MSVALMEASITSAVLQPGRSYLSLALLQAEPERVTAKTEEQEQEKRICRATCKTAGHRRVEDEVSDKEDQRRESDASVGSARRLNGRRELCIASHVLRSV